VEGDGFEPSKAEPEKFIFLPLATLCNLPNLTVIIFHPITHVHIQLNNIIRADLFVMIEAMAIRAKKCEIA